MKTSKCDCGNTLYFGNDTCVQCGRVVGLCEACLTVVPINDQGTCPQCQERIIACANRKPHGICNVWTRPVADEPVEKTVCRFCELTTVIPDLSLEGNVARWRALESAKQRVLLGVGQAGFPTNFEQLKNELPLTFEFKATTDEDPANTGHANGCITINLSEADPVQREITRQQFGEPHRTLVGHFRHELGHYYWDLLVKPGPVDEYRQLFGDERSPTYAEARQRYYKQGPPEGWSAHYVSAYATMHPWEDFAESFNTLLDMVAIVETAAHFGIETGTQDGTSGFEDLLSRYQRVGIAANEMNREMGLLDLVPEVFTGEVARKLSFVHRLAGQDVPAKVGP